MEIDTGTAVLYFIVALAFIFAMAVLAFAKRYKKVSPDQAMVV